jgi:hypothetical protein
MQFLAITSDKGGVKWESHASSLQAEARQAWTLYLTGSVRSIWFTEAKDAVLLLEAASREEAEKALDSLPLVKEGLITYELHSLLPYSGLSRIMDEPES